MPYIKVRNNARVGWKKRKLRNLSVLAQRNDLQKWKDSVSYGKIVVETVFSSIKRMFDRVYVYSAGRLKNMMQKMLLKAICITK